MQRLKSFEKAGNPLTSDSSQGWRSR